MFCSYQVECIELGSLGSMFYMYWATMKIGISSIEEHLLISKCSH